MSVPNYDKEIAPPQFITTAADLEALTGQICSRLPRRISFTRTRYITDCANAILEHAVRANSIYVRTVDDAAERMWHLNEAYSSCYVLHQKISALSRKMPCREVRKRHPDGTEDLWRKPCITPGLIRQWTDMVMHEEKLLKGIIRYDRRRYAANCRVVSKSRAMEQRDLGLRRLRARTHSKMTTPDTFRNRIIGR